MDVCVCIYCYFIIYSRTIFIKKNSHGQYFIIFIVGIVFNIIVSYDCMYVERLREILIGRYNKLMLCCV